MDRLAERVANMSDGQRERLGSYLADGPPLSEQLRLAIDASGLSRYAICKATGIDQGALSKFMAGKIGMRLAHVDAVCALLGLELRARRQGKKGG